VEREKGWMQLSYVKPQKNEQEKDLFKFFYGVRGSIIAGTGI